MLILLLGAFIDNIPQFSPDDEAVCSSETSVTQPTLTRSKLTRAGPKLYIIWIIERIHVRTV
jgi:hypothetical protein